MDVGPGRREELLASTLLLSTVNFLEEEFIIACEAYDSSRVRFDVDHAALHFSHLVENFFGFGVLQKEMTLVVIALGPSKTTRDDIFYKLMFRKLPGDIKYRVISSVANLFTNPYHRFIVVHALLLEPHDSEFRHGDSLINRLLKEESALNYETPLNRPRYHLACRGTPTIAFCPNFTMSPETWVLLLHSVCEYYVCYIFMKKDEDQENRIFPYCRGEAVMELRELSVNWKALILTVKVIGRKLNFGLIDLFCSDLNLVLQMEAQRIRAMVGEKLRADTVGEAAARSVEISLMYKEVFFVMSTIFFYSLYQFSKFIGPAFAPRNDTGRTLHHYVLVERMYYALGRDEPVRGSINVSSKASPEVTQNLVPSFVMTVAAWQLLYSKTLLKEDFRVLCQAVQIKKWPCYGEFFINFIVYLNKHEAKTLLTRAINSSRGNLNCLQLASCLAHIGEHVSACEYLFNMILSGQLPHVTAVSSPAASTSLQNPSSQFMFICYCFEDILDYTVEVLISMHVKKLSIFFDERDIILAHLIILIQYKWPQEQELFMQCLEHIKINGRLHYLKLFDYVIIQDILNYLVALTVAGRDSVVMELVPKPIVESGEKKTVPRMSKINRRKQSQELGERVKEQMKRSNERIDEVIELFIRQEKDHIYRLVV